MKARAWTAVWLCGALIAMPIRLSAQGQQGPGAARSAAPGAQAAALDPVVEAREAYRRRDRSSLAALAAKAQSTGHPLSGWVDYWELNARLRDANTEDVEVFYRRHRGSYVEDRLRNDWLLELGRRRDFTAFSADLPRFRMNDDREVACYALWAEHQAGKDVRAAAQRAWLAQREADDGCQGLARTLLDERKISSAEVWQKARWAVDTNRPRAARAAIGLISPGLEESSSELLDKPQRWLQRTAPTPGRVNDELATLAVMRLATSDHEAAAEALRTKWERELPDELKAWAWAAVGKWAGIRLDEAAPDHFQRAARFTHQARLELDWPDDTLAWKVRAALRANQGQGRWQMVMQAIAAMSEAEQRDPAWMYWKAQGLLRLGAGDDKVGLQQQARELLASVANPLSFYGQLAIEALQQPLLLPAAPAALSPAERDAAQRHPGLTRALQLLSLGLRSEGVREWNFSLRGMSDRELLAAAQRACDARVWDRCITASERTREEIDLSQRYPTPLRDEVITATRESRVDPAFVYGLIRQESRFVTDARSGVGASGLMQLMPATARYTAKRLGIEYRAGMINEIDINLRLGTGYLKMVLDDFGGLQPLAAAAYNAGPSRPRRWREGPVIDAAAWTEGIPFNETRDYVKKVLANANVYAAVLAGLPQNPAIAAPAASAVTLPSTPVANAPSAASAVRQIAIPPSLREQTSIRARLGRDIGPRDPRTAEPDRTLP